MIVGMHRLIVMMVESEGADGMADAGVHAVSLRVR